MSDIPADVMQAAYDCARGIYLNVDDAGAPYLTSDDIEEIAKAILAERDQHIPLDGWQPIETAPTDGTYILCVCMKVKAGCERHLGHMEVDCWKDRYHGFGKFNTDSWPATHWMPIPETPETEDPTP